MFFFLFCLNALFFFLLVPEFVQESEDVDFQTVFQKISEESISGLPQGGGIFAK